MNDNRSADVSQRLLLDRLCDSFENQWQQCVRSSKGDTERPRIEDFLTQVEEDLQPPLFRELLSVELDYVSDSLTSSQCNGYLKRFPSLRETVDELIASTVAVKRPGAAADVAPKRLGRYLVQRTLGRGSFGAVYEAIDPELDRSVAIKVPFQSNCQDGKSAELRAEARLVAQLRHEHLVPVFDTGESEDGHVYIVYELIEGMTLAEQMRRQPLAFREAAQLVAKIGKALDYAHRKRIVHRDVKPANILLDANSKPYLADFGLALRDADFGDFWRQGGTIAYMSPEQARGEGHLVDGRSDIFSLGVVFYEMLTCERPFRGKDWESMREHVVSGEARPPRMINDAIPSELERICMKALSVRCADRYNSAMDFTLDIQNFTAGHPSEVLPQGRDGRSMTHELTVIPRGLQAFDERDAGFFLRLLPGPRARGGLPQSIHFWKTRIETDNPDHTFRVSMIYGPSGSGKSSFLRAGLIPRLEDSIIPVRVECRAGLTTERLLEGLQSAWPELDEVEDVVNAVTRLRTELGPRTGKRTLIVLDQFEQWLHAHGGHFDTRLVEAIRQCDGRHAQSLLLVRDDFWLAVSRLLDELDVNLVEGENTMFFDLFDERHAKKVLREFGRAYDCLPKDELEETADQRDFVHRVIDELSQDSWIVPIRLAVFAEMVKSKPWTPQSLEDIEGTEGVGVMFLDGLFSRSATPARRMHRDASRRILESFVPDGKYDIQRKEVQLDEMMALSQYTDKPREFADVMRILEIETRLISPTDPYQSPFDNDSQAEPARRYQLTHDYLVHALKRWLTREQRSTRGGRAQLNLAELASFWQKSPNARSLPSVWELMEFLCFTRYRHWTSTQRRMIASASLRSAGIATLLLTVVLLIFGFSYEMAARRKVDELLHAELHELPLIRDRMGIHRFRAASLFGSIKEDRAVGPLQRLRADLAGQYYGDPLPLRELMKERTKPEVIRTVFLFLNDESVKRESYLESCWNGLINPDPQRPYRDELRDAAVVAQLAAHDEENWKKVKDSVAQALLSAESVNLDHWSALMAPARKHLKQPLEIAFAGPDALQRSRAASVLLEQFDDNKVLLLPLLLDADFDHLRSMYPHLRPDLRTNAALGNNEFFSELEALMKFNLQRIAGEEKVATARRIANAAILLIQHDRRNSVVDDLLKQPSLDPTLRSQLLIQVGAITLDLQYWKKLLYDLFDQQRPGDDYGDAIQVVLLALAGCDYRLFEEDDIDSMIEDARNVALQVSDSGIDVAFQRLMQRWPHQGELISGSEESSKPPRLMLGVRRDKDGLYECEMSSLEVTRGQFKRFLDSLDPDLWRQRRSREDPDYESLLLSVAASESDSQDISHFPVNHVSFAEAAAYCNWLTVEMMSAEDQCYLFLRDRQPIENLAADMEAHRHNHGSTPSADWYQTYWNTVEIQFFPGKMGLRLPTVDEWRYACLGSINAPYSCGSTDDLLYAFAWYSPHSNHRSNGLSTPLPRPVGQKFPNCLGFFDLHGNVAEWCHPVESGVSSADSGSVTFRMDAQGVLLGGGYASASSELDVNRPRRALMRSHAPESGFRVVQSRLPYEPSVSP